MAAQQNYRTHRLLCLMLNDASEICHYSDPISRYLYNESTRRPKPAAHSRLSQSRSSRVDLLQDYRKMPFLHAVCSPCPCSSGMTRMTLLVGSGKLAHSHHGPEPAAFEREWRFPIPQKQLCP